MEGTKKIGSALISIFHKDGMEQIIRSLDALKVNIYSTGGTYDYICKLGIKATAVESLTDYPSILGGRVKTLHPKVFGGILARRENIGDVEQLEKYEIPCIDLVIVDLYPFEETVASGASEQEIIEKIDIGGISLIRAAAKNYNDVMVVPSSSKYPELLQILNNGKGYSTLEERKRFAGYGFEVSSRYDTAISRYFSKGISLRYGENPHQKGNFYGDLDSLFTKLNGKEISYNNLLDIDAAVSLIKEFEEPTFAVIKHNNACGIASRNNPAEAWHCALQGDPVSAFGGIIVTNRNIDNKTAEEINKIFFEIIIAPSFDDKALELLCSKKNRIILKLNDFELPAQISRTLLNGVLVQDRDNKTDRSDDFKVVTEKAPTTTEIQDLVFANILVKHTKSNAIVLTKDKQLIGSGTGQTSRVDALKQAIEKARTFKFDLKGAVMASDAFFPFPDCVEIAHESGITAVVQPGGSINDKASIEACNKNKMAMVVTGTRHFKH